MSLFARPEQNYLVSDDILQAILVDEPNPLKRIVELVPDGARVLDVGAGNGLLARLFNLKKVKVDIDGVEPNGFAASLASQNYEYFYQGFLESFPRERGLYDFVVAADVIEHTVDPVAFVEQLKSFLAPNGAVVLSVPNIAFAGVRLALLDGRFDYVDSGILERTHLRFFTYDTLCKVLNHTKLFIRETYFLQREIGKTEFGSLDFKQYRRIRFEDEKTAKTYQLLVVAQREPCELKERVISVRSSQEGFMHKVGEILRGFFRLD